MLLASYQAEEQMLFFLNKEGSLGTDKVISDAKTLTRTRTRKNTALLWISSGA